MVVVSAGVKMSGSILITAGEEVMGFVLISAGVEVAGYVVWAEVEVKSSVEVSVVA